MNNVCEWLVEHEYADNLFSASGMANGLLLAELTDDEIKARAELYRRWRPTHKSAVKSKQAFQLVLVAPWLNPDDYPDRQMDLLQSCGHRNSSIFADSDGTSYCMDCADEANKYAYENQTTAV